MQPSTYLDVTIALMFVTGLLGYYIGERGVSGVRGDLNDIKMDLENIKAKYEKATTVISAPAAEAVTVTNTTPTH